MHKTLLQDMTNCEFKEYLRRQPDPLAILAIGALEQHGPHIALGRDSYGALHVAMEVAERADAFVVHPCWPGVSEHHMGFAGTISLEVETLANLVRDVVYSLTRHGVNKVLVVNNHGGNSEALGYAVTLCRRKCGRLLEIMLAPSTASTLTSMENEERIGELDIHAGKRETARMLAAYPDLVQIERVREWTPTTIIPRRLRLALKDPAEHQMAMAVFNTIQHPTLELTSSGIFGFANPYEANAEEGRIELSNRIELLVRLISFWREVSRDWKAMAYNKPDASAE